MSESWDAFQHLVQCMSKRYQSACNGDAERPRIVFIIGAGTSVWSSMPLWGDIKGDVLDAAQSGFSEFLKEACIRLETTIGSDCRSMSDDRARRKRLIASATTDQLCAVACGIELAREKVLAKLRDLYSGPGSKDAGLPPQLAYELIAHFIKHGFGDHVVSFNFDDLMTTALRSEMGPDEFELIASDHALVGDPPQPGTELPRVIQLHGSVRSEPTLRFTMDSVGVLTPHMKRILLTTLFPDGRPVHLVSLGYSWHDSDLINWLASLSDRISSLTIVTRSQAENDLSGRVRDHAWRELRVLETSDIGERDRVLSIDHVLWALWNELRSTIKPAPPPAARHLILGYLFGPTVSMDDQLLLGSQDLNNAHRPDTRLTAEIILHVIKCQGMVTASMMARDLRIRRYRQMVPHSLLKKTIKAFLKAGSYPEVLETLFSSAVTTTDFAAIFDTLQFNTRDLLEPRIKNERIHLVHRRAYTPNRSPSEADMAPGFLEEHVGRIQSSPEIEIVRSIDSRTEWMFNDAIPLTNFPMFEAKTQKVLVSTWTHLFLVAETGEWLTRDPFLDCMDATRNSREVLMINASLPSEKDWKRKPLIDKTLDRDFDRLYETRRIQVSRAYMPWWQHNRHLTLAYNSNNGEFLGAVFFQRPNKASRISPVYTERREDCREVFLTFLTYVRRTLERRIFEESCREHENSHALLLDGAFVNRSVAIALQVLSSDSGLPEHNERLKKLLEVIAQLAIRIWPEFPTKVSCPSPSIAPIPADSDGEEGDGNEGGDGSN